MTASGTSDSSDTLQKELVVQNKMGIHARPAAMIVRVANTYAGEVWVEKDDEQVNGKSIMGLMMLAAGKGSKLKVKAEGPTEEGIRMLEEMTALFERRFEEA
ncbi:MAG: HPr family phosphocarrier protein [Verrucomicrobiota bacterium]